MAAGINPTAMSDDMMKRAMMGALTRFFLMWSNLRKQHAAGKLLQRPFVARMLALPRDPRLPGGGGVVIVEVDAGQTVPRHHGASFVKAIQEVGVEAEFLVVVELK